jgi:hypothetical protein
MRERCRAVSAEAVQWHQMTPSERKTAPPPKYTYRDFEECATLSADFESARGSGYGTPSPVTATPGVTPTPVTTPPHRFRRRRRRQQRHRLIRPTRIRSTGNRQHVFADGSYSACPGAAPTTGILPPTLTTEATNFWLAADVPAGGGGAWGGYTFTATPSGCLTSSGPWLGWEVFIPEN